MSILTVATGVVRTVHWSRTRGASSQPVALEEVVERVSRGEHAAFAELYDATARSSYTLACEILDDRHLAGQALVAAYLEAWRTAPSYDGPSPREWITHLVQRHAYGLSLRETV